MGKEGQPAREAEAKFFGIIIERVPFDPEKFIAFCREERLRHGSAARALFAVAVAVP